MKAITIWQPWASLLVSGQKKYETRSWATAYRGPIAIHAAKRPVHRTIDALVAENEWDTLALFASLFPGHGVSYGAVVGKGRSWCVATSLTKLLRRSSHRRNVPWAISPWDGILGSFKRWFLLIRRYRLKGCRAFGNGEAAHEAEMSLLRPRYDAADPIAPVPA